MLLERVELYPIFYVWVLLSILVFISSLLRLKYEKEAYNRNIVIKYKLYDYLGLHEYIGGEPFAVFVFSVGFLVFIWVSSTKWVGKKLGERINSLIHHLLDKNYLEEDNKDIESFDDFYEDK